MKIMHIVQAPGGVERYIGMYLENSNGKSIKNIIIASYDYDYKKYADRVYAFENVEMCREISIVRDMKSIIEVRKCIKKYKPDIIYCHSSKAGAIGRIANIGKKNKIIYNPHGWAFNMQCPKIKKLIYIYIEKILALLTDRIIAISPFEKKSALKYKICKENKIVVINNGIDTKKYISNEYRLKKCELGIDDDTYVVGMVGRLSKQKAPDIFVKASELIEKEIEKVFFIIVGDGEEKLEIEKMINDRKLTEKFLVTGWIDNPYDYINLFDQALLLSRWEGFGLVLAEYMLMKKPIVATAVDAIPDLIEDKENGYLVEIDNYEMVANNVIALYKNEEERLRISENGFNKVNELYKIERVVSEHLVLYNDLL